MNKKIDKLLKHRMSWLLDNGPEDAIAVSSRIRLARNIRDIPFPAAAGQEQLIRVMTAVLVATERSGCIEDPIELEMMKLGPLERRLLLERHLISREFSEIQRESALIISSDESEGVMVNEEDHLRIQTILPGIQLKENWTIINKIDNSLSKELSFAFHKDYGFLTSCPTNVGTGMRASVMLHLPGLVLSGHIAAIGQAVNKLGLAVRGIFGEGSECLGNLFQVSNQSTLGESEEQIVGRLSSLITQIISHEKNARSKLLESKKNFLLDQIGRSYGTLSYAYRINSQEALNSLSLLRLGVDMGMFSSLDIHTINELFILAQSGHLQKFADKQLESIDRDIFRAELIRQRIKPVENNNSG